MKTSPRSKLNAGGWILLSVVLLQLLILAKLYMGGSGGQEKGHGKAAECSQPAHHHASTDPGLSRACQAHRLQPFWAPTEIGLTATDVSDACEESLQAQYSVGWSLV